MSETKRAVPADERVKPVRLFDNDTGVEYVLDFSRDSVRFAESRGFKPDDVLEYPASRIPELFFYAFRKNHKNIAKNQSDKILEEKLGGMTEALLARLIQLYNQAALTHLIASEEDSAKNARMTVEL
jgi:hypothetical protein